MLCLRFIFFKPRRRRLGGVLLCLRFIFFKPSSRRLGGFLLCLRFINRAAVGGRGSRTAFGFFKPRSRRLGGFSLCLRFILFLFVGNYTQTPRTMSPSANCRPFLSSFGELLSPDDVTISQLQAISHLFSSYPPSGAFCQVSKLTIQTEHGRL